MTYLPVNIAGCLVVQQLGTCNAAGFGQWRATNDFLRANSGGLAYRLSRKLGDFHFDLPGGHKAIIPWGHSFWSRYEEERKEDTPWLTISGLDPPPQGYEKYSPSRSRNNCESFLNCCKWRICTPWHCCTVASSSRPRNDCGQTAVMALQNHWAALELCLHRL